MICSCNPPQALKQCTVIKSGPNHGRVFFVFPNNNCDVYVWQKELMKDNFHQRYMAHPSQNVSTDRSNYGKILLKVMVGQFEIGPPFKFWYDVQCPIDNQLRQYFTTFPEHQRRYNAKVKMWSFDFAIYEQFISTLLSSQYEATIQVDELPRFLVRGIKKYMESIPAHVSDVNLLDTMMDAILPFQLEGVEFIVQRGGRGMIADEMVLPPFKY